MLDEFEIEFGDLVVEDKNHFVWEISSGLLERWEGIGIDVIPIGEVFGMEQSFNISVNILSYNGIFLMELLDIV